jgi:hypothetical protein
LIREGSAGRDDVAEPRRVWSVHHTVHDLALIGMSYRQNVAGWVHEAQHANPRIHKLGRHQGHEKPVGARSAGA